MKQKLKILSLLFGSLFGKQTFAQVDTTAFEETISVIVEEPIRFIGEKPALNKFLSKHIKYPQQALKDNVEGQVVVQFIVEANGTLKDITIAQSVREDLDNEAIRIIKLTKGKWRPAKENGKPITRKMTLPINFYFK